MIPELKKAGNIHRSKKLIPIGLFIIFLLYSVIHCSTVEKSKYDESKINLTIAHWQLDRGYREALSSIIDEYQRLHPDVQIHQLAVSEQYYRQLINTTLTAEDLPDIIELDHRSVANIDEYLTRYFQPLSSYLKRPNPYNKGTDLEGTPWQDTFIDRMRTWYRPALQDYFAVPTSVSVCRLFYNKDLLREITGKESIPKSFSEFIKTLELIKKYTERTGKHIIPISVSRYDATIIYWRYIVGFTANYEDTLDMDRDGIISGLELYLGLKDGKIRWDDDVNKACYELLRLLSNYFERGFTAIDRDQRTLFFIQGRAVMMAGTSWEFTSISKETKFPIGVCDFPIPGPNEPFGKYTKGKLSEAATGTAAGFSVCRLSKHKDKAIDFLQFLTSKRINEDFNSKIDQIPSIRGARIKEELLPFMPDPEGYTTMMRWYWQDKSRAIYYGALLEYLQGLISFDEFGNIIENALNDPHYGWRYSLLQDIRQMRTTVRMQERLISILNLDLLFPRKIPDADKKLKEAVLKQIRELHKIDIYRYIAKNKLNFKLE